MRLFELFESEQSDKAARQEAARVHESIRNWLTVRAELLDEFLQARGDSYVLPLSILDIGYNDLYVQFSPKTRNVMGAFGHSGTKPVIVMYCLLRPHSLQYLETRFGSAKQYFVHEFQHYLSRSYHRKSINLEPRVYFNNEDETNAYYQEGAHDAETLFLSVMRLNPEKGKEMFGNKSVNELIEYCLRFFNEDFRTHLEPHRKKAFMKRLARFVQETIIPIIHN